jgi:hypothetical protein
MRSRCLSIAACFALVALASPAAPPDTKTDLPALLSRMDKAAAEFKAMTAQVTYVTHTDVLNEDNTEAGTAIMQKVQPGEVAGMVDFVTPDPHSVTFEKRHVQRYFPKIKTLEVFDLEKNGEQLDKFLMIGFGTTGAELARDYDMAASGAETPKGQTGRFVRLLLSPKSPEARLYVKTLELWIPQDGGPYPVRERILQPSGDYVVVTYSDLKINPVLKADAWQLKLPPGVKTVYPGR